MRQQTRYRIADIVDTVTNQIALVGAGIALSMAARSLGIWP